MKTYLALIILFPLLGAVANTLLGSRLPRRISEGLACASIWGSFVASVLALSAYREPVTVELLSWLKVFDFSAPITLYLDPLSLSLALMITFVCGLIHLYSVAYMKDDPSYVRYFALLNLFVGAMLLLVLAENLPLLYLGWEGVGFCSYALIGFWYKDEKNATAGRKAFIVTRVGDVAFGIAIVWLFKLCGTVSITSLNSMGGSVSIGEVTVIGLLLLVGAMGKSAQLPLMVWLPDAMAGPTPVSAQIHAATMVTAGVYLLMRLSPLIGASGTVLAAIAITGALTAFYGASCAMVQRDLKRVLAYSTISQIGFMMLGVGAGAITAATFHLLVHAFFKALLFLAAGCVITALHHEQDIFRMGGLRRSLPGTFWLFLAGALCLAGFPFTGGFFSKDGILTAVWEKGGGLYGALYLLGLVTALLTAFYTFRTLLLVFEGRASAPLSHRVESGEIPSVNGEIPSVNGEIRSVSGVEPLMLLTLIPLAIVGIGGGLLNLPSLLGTGLLDTFLSPLSHHPTQQLINSTTQQLNHLTTQPLNNSTTQPLNHSTEFILLLVATVVSLAGIAGAWFRYGGLNRTLRLEEAKVPASGLAAFLLNGWYFDALYGFLFVRPFVKMSRILWEKVDEGGIDDSLDRFAALLGRGGVLLGSWTCGKVSIYLLSLAGGAALLLGWFAWSVL